MKKNKTKTRKIKVKVDSEEELKLSIITDIFKFFNRMQNKYKGDAADTAYVEYLALCCLIDFLKAVKGKKTLTQIFKERINL